MKVTQAHARQTRLPKFPIFATLPVFDSPGRLTNAADGGGVMSSAVNYARAIAIAMAAIALRWLLIPWLGSDVPYATLIGAIAIATY